MRIHPLLLALAFILPLSAAAEDEDDGETVEEEAEDEPGQTLEIGLRGSRGQEANTHDFDWGPTLSWGVLTKRLGSSRFKYELEFTYNDAMTDFQSARASQATRVRAAEFRYAKIHLLELFGFDFKKRISIVPYASGGIQYAYNRQDSRNFDEDLGEYVSESTTAHYWSPTFGVGAEVALNKKMTLALDYDQNSEGGDRKITRLSLELKYAVFGED